jgi:hypothetical protein
VSKENTAASSIVENRCAVGCTVADASIGDVSVARACKVGTAPLAAGTYQKSDAVGSGADSVELASDVELSICVKQDIHASFDCEDLASQNRDCIGDLVRTVVRDPCCGGDVSTNIRLGC